MQRLQTAAGTGEVCAEHRYQSRLAVLEGASFRTGTTMVGVVGVGASPGGERRVRGQRVQAGRIVEQGGPVIERTALGGLAHRPEVNSILLAMPQPCHR
jgi:hypothetical protein